MTTHRTTSLLLIVLFSMMIATSAAAAPAAETDNPPDPSSVKGVIPYKLYLPIIYVPPSPTLIINHNNIDISQIPDYWLEEAKKLTFHYAHTSHGSQITTGLTWLELQNSKYSVAIRESGTEGLPPAEIPPALRIYDGNPPETYIEPGDYWDGVAGINRTRAVADTGNYDYSMWSWCGQQSSNSEATVQRYLDNLALLDTEYPNMRFILMTGHSDYPSFATLDINNNLVRAYAAANHKVLFDFADIERYDPDGVYHAPIAGDAGGGCSWCDAYCTAHPAYCANFDQMGDCAHTHKLFCKMKANAFWWMMARLAGWQP
jgi:hypothetical protein